MRVLYVHQSADLYGSDRTLLTLIDRLRSFEVEAIVLLPTDGPLKTELEALGVETHIAPVGKLSRQRMHPAGWLHLVRELAQSLNRIDRILDGRAVDLVHSNTLAVLAGGLWSWRRRVPHLWHVHELIVKPRLLSLIFPRLLVVWADRVICNSTLTRAWILGTRPRSERKVVTVWNGVPELRQVSEAERLAARQRMGATPDDIVVSLLGRFNHFKGQHLLCEAVDLLHARGQAGRLRFVFVGSPPPGQEVYQQELQRRMNASPLRHRMSLLGFLPDPSAIWEATDIAVVPSTSPEPFGLVAVEAMRSGKPVIAAAHGGLLDIVEDGVTGLLFPPRNARALADQLARLAEDKGLRMRLGGAGRHRQSTVFTLEAHVQGVLREYHELVRPANALAPAC